jgi:chromosome partitioning protein
MTHVIAVINQKGGVGKSTLVSYLGVLAHLDGFTTAVVDTDASTSLAKWMRRRAKKEKQGPVLLIANDETQTDPNTGKEVIVRAAEERLKEAVERVRKTGADWLFIDTGAGKHPVHRAAAKLADIVLIPTTPSIRDQEITGATVELVRDENKPGFLLISKGSQGRATNDRAALDLSSIFKLPSLSTHIVLRTPIQTADLRGETLLDNETKDSSAKAGQAEFRALWQWLREHFGETAQEAVGA